MMPSPQDSNGGEMQPYGMRNMPGGMPLGSNPMVNQTPLFSSQHLYSFSSLKYHDPHLAHMPSIPPDISHHGSINGIDSRYYSIE